MIDARIDLFDPSFSNHCKFLFHVNTSIKRQETYLIGTETIRSKNMERQLGVHGFDPNFGNSSVPGYLTKKIIECSIQVINGIPFIGIITGMLSAMIYYLASRYVAGTVHQDIANLWPGNSKKAEALLELAKKHYLREIDEHGNLSKTLLNELASIILEKPVLNIDELTSADCLCICKDYLKVNEAEASEVKKQISSQFYTRARKVLYSNLYVSYLTNLFVCSIISLPPFFKPVIRSFQLIRGVQDGP
jgi:hypothetical protein